MVTQSRRPAFLLTRPPRQSQRFVAELAERFGAGLRICESPVIAPRFRAPDLPSGPFDALVFTSETGVEGFAALNPANLPTLAYCVGDRTADAARMIGLVAVSAQGDALALAQLLEQSAPGQRLLYLHGQETRRDLDSLLRPAGITLSDAVVYEQAECPLTPEARSLLAQQDEIVLPLFSPRSAQIFFRQCAELAPKARIVVIALSPAVAEAVPPGGAHRILVAQAPTASEMITQIAALFDAGTAA
ncbi:MAG: uroporphyrinogen-III synthase [Pseudorhodobacter sp.]|nr:uroporphyrinogen-III synthase [Pseudorhodobacter sp.]